MIVRFPGRKGGGTRNRELISFIDLAPTMFSLVGIKPPQYLDGKAFMGEYKVDKKPSYIHAASDRFGKNVADLLELLEMSDISI